VPQNLVLARVWGFESLLGHQRHLDRRGIKKLSEIKGGLLSCRYTGEVHAIIAMSRPWRHPATGLFYFRPMGAHAWDQGRSPLPERPQSRLAPPLPDPRWGCLHRGKRGQRHPRTRSRYHWTELRRDALADGAAGHWAYPSSRGWDQQLGPPVCIGSRLTPLLPQKFHVPSSGGYLP
jgi:hypothetical protein